MYEISNFSYMPNRQNMYLPSWINNNESYANNRDATPQKIIYMDDNEQIPKHEVDDIDALFKDKVYFKQASAFQVFYLIKERECLRDNNISNIESRLMYCHENLSRLHMVKSPMNGRNIGGLQKMLLDLEKQGRDERVSSWRDTLKLKLDLLGVLKDHQTLKRQEALLEDVS